MKLKLTVKCRSIPQSEYLDKLIVSNNYKINNISFEGLVCNDFNIPKQNDFPIAPIEAYGIKGINPGSFIYNATPCFFSLQRDYFKFEKNLEFECSQENLKELCNELNVNFSDNRSYFFIRNCKLFFLTQKNNNISTYFPEEINQVIERKFLPFGDDKLWWHSFINEIQMFLHSSKINEIREAAFKLPINTIWFSGGGEVVRNIESGNYFSSYSNMKLIKNISLIQSNYYFFDILEGVNFDGNITNIYYDLGDHMQTDNLFNSIYDGFMSGKLNKINMNLCFGFITVNLNINKFSKFKFWRPKLTIQDILNGI